ncbi:MAG TPA: hypothetical protein VIK31_03190 [Propionibacteriaceae bacterium]
MAALKLDHITPRAALAEADRLHEEAEKCRAVGETVGDRHDCFWVLKWQECVVAIPEDLLVKWLSLAATVATDLEMQATYIEGRVRVVQPTEDVPF